MIIWWKWSIIVKILMTVDGYYSYNIWAKFLIPKTAKLQEPHVILVAKVRFLCFKFSLYPLSFSLSKGN